MMAPLALDIAEELWERTGRPYSVHQQSWFAWEAELAKEDEITLVVQVNGKLRDRIHLGRYIGRRSEAPCPRQRARPEAARQR